MYVIDDCDDFVLKVAINKKYIVCNWIEIAAYHGLGDKLRLALVYSWSNSGKYLVMEKLDVGCGPHPSFTPPGWVTDLKPSSVGKDKAGNIKLCDYALVKPPSNFPNSLYA